MNFFILIVCFCTVFAYYNEKRPKRDATGALHIVTNHALPIHADVKSDGTAKGTAEGTEKPCPKSKYPPSFIENGVAFQVTPPQDSFFPLQSLRKSWPVHSKLETARSISRFITLVVLLVSAGVEFFPLLKDLFYYIHSFLY